MEERQAPQADNEERERLFDKMYVSNIYHRLRDLNQPNDIDRKRWIWELLQNAKDTIAKNPHRDTINARILINGDTVKFQHDGDPFTAGTRLGLLYKYSEDKENVESTGRFGTGFLTTHCLSKIVTIESNMYGDDNEVIGFSVTMYRDGLDKKELIEGLTKMRDSQKYWDKPFEWTTYTYHVNSESGRRAILLGKDNFKENITQTLLFCKEIASVELHDNGEITYVRRVDDDGFKATFQITSGTQSITRSFIYLSSDNYDEELSVKYKTPRSIRLQTACEIDEAKNIISTAEKTSLFCVFPLVGIETQMQFPIIVNSPDFEPDSERQSLLLNGNIIDQEKGIVTEVGINQKILAKVPDMYDKLVEYLSREQYNKAFSLANGLKQIKDHEKLDKKWYQDEIISKMRNILSKYPIAQTKSCKGSVPSYCKLTDCIFVNEKKAEDEISLYNLISEIYPQQLVIDNKDWAHSLWKEDNSTIKVWGTKEFCTDIEAKLSISGLSLNNYVEEESEGVYEQRKFEWYNRFLKFVIEVNELLLKEHALLPNMNGTFLKKDTEGFKQAEGISETTLTMLSSLGEDMKPLLLHSLITKVSLDSKFNSISFSAKANSLAKVIIDTSPANLNDSAKLSKLLPLISIIVSSEEKYEIDFITKRKRTFEIFKDLFELSEAESITDNCLLKSAWESLDIWLTNLFISTIENKKNLSALPNNLGAKWLNSAIISLGISLSKMQNVAILPNQNGDFCKSPVLYIDNDIPDILKDSVFDNIGISYKNILIHKDIDSKTLGKTQSKSILDFANALAEATAGLQYMSGDKKIMCFDMYRKYDETVMKKVANYLIQIIPDSDKDGVATKQKSLKKAAQFFLGDSCKGKENTITFYDTKLWSQINIFICKEIIYLLEQAQTINQLATKLNIDDNSIIDNLNTVYSYIDDKNISVTNKKYVLNQNGAFVTKDTLYKESESIDKELKDIISLVTDDANNYYNILVDSRCLVTLSKQKSLKDTYCLIDDSIKQLYDYHPNWEDQNFREAARLLIEVWGDNNKNTFDENHFPKVFPVRDSICMNVIWTKGERQQLQQLKNKLGSEELSYVVEHINEIKDISNKVHDLESTVEELRAVIAALKSGRDVDFDPDEDSDSAKQKQYDAQIEAQKKLMELFPTWQFPYGFTKQDETGKPYCHSTFKIIDEKGNTIPIVLKSYKSRKARFKINTNEWEWVVIKNAKLFVYTSVNGTLDIVEVPQEDLIMKQSNVSITFSSDNLDADQYKDRVSDFATTLHYFTGLHFNFDQFHIKDNAPKVRDLYAIHTGIQTEHDI